MALEIPALTNQDPLAEEVRQYLESHPQVADYFRMVEKTFGIFGQYLRLTSPRITLRELPGGSNAEADLSATLSRANC